MLTVKDIGRMDFEDVPVDPYWNIGTERESKMHRIHAYPAKFPAFITTKAIDYAKDAGLAPGRIADIFCGCGTVAFEARRASIDFWGCDINPVATMIAKVKSKGPYQRRRLEEYLDRIVDLWSDGRIRPDPEYQESNARLQHWFDRRHYDDLARLKRIIETCTPEHSDYRRFFVCAFSNILKATSRWLTKSIKPQIDPDKRPVEVMDAFVSQVRFMMSASQEARLPARGRSEIVTANFLEEENLPKVDLIVTSPPYVTSYEYADLHQLSSIWLGYATDYRELRAGSIGSSNAAYGFRREAKRLNSTGHFIVSLLLDRFKAKARAVAKYFLDMQAVARRTHGMLTDKGMALFVIGNTEYKGVRIDNARHLAESLLAAGFSDVRVAKRRISNKILTPYRDRHGRFSSIDGGRRVYAEEFIVVGRR